MAQSPEYPDLKWMPPKSWSNANRTSVQVIVIHDTEGSEGLVSAEDGAAYDQRRTDGTSTHYFHDQDSTVQCVRTEDVAYAARPHGNRIGIQHELCGRASQGAAGWADAASTGTIRQAAKQVARDCAKWGIPVRKLTPAQVASGVKGICGHADITKAFPQDNGNHTDPGPDFPWSSLLAQVRDFMDGDDMPTVSDIWGAEFGPNNARVTASQMLARAAADAAAAKASAAAALATAAAIAKKVDAIAVDEAGDAQDIAQRVVAALKGTDPATTAAALKAVLGPAAAKAVGQILATS